MMDRPTVFYLFADWTVTHCKNVLETVVQAYRTDVMYRTATRIIKVLVIIILTLRY